MAISHKYIVTVYSINTLLLIYYGYDVGAVLHIIRLLTIIFYVCLNLFKWLCYLNKLCLTLLVMHIINTMLSIIFCIWCINTSILYNEYLLLLVLVIDVFTAIQLNSDIIHLHFIICTVGNRHRSSNINEYINYDVSHLNIVTYNE